MIALLGYYILVVAILIVALAIISPLRPGPSLSRKGAPPEERKSQDKAL